MVLLRENWLPDYWAVNKELSLNLVNGLYEKSDQPKTQPGGPDRERVVCLMHAYDTRHHQPHIIKNEDPSDRISMEEKKND